MTESVSRPIRFSLRWRSVISIALCLVILMATGVAFVALASLKKPAAERMQEERVYNVEVFRIEQVDLQEYISAFGTARADREVVLASQVSGQVVDIHPNLRVGELVQGNRLKVRQYGEESSDPGLGIGLFASLTDQVLDGIDYGDLLVRVDPRTFRERVRQARNRLLEDGVQLKQLQQEEINSRRLLERTQADFETYQREYDRVRNLKDRNAVTASQLADAELQLRRYEVARIQEQDRLALIPIRREQLEELRRTHQSELELAELDLERTEVRPTFTGRLSEVMVEEGQYVRVGDPLVRITDVARVEIPLAVSLGDYPAIADRIEQGESVRVEFAESTTSAPLWFGTIDRVSPEADELTRTVMVYAVVENGVGLNAGRALLLPGAFVHARIEGPLIPEALAIPRDCIINDAIYVMTHGAEVDAGDTPEGSSRNDSKSIGVVERRQVRVLRKLNSVAMVAVENFDGTRNQPGDRVIMTNLDVIHQGAKVDSQVQHELDEELARQEVESLRRLNP